jgi:tetratricopeptide (TPR) repeat protein
VTRATMKRALLAVIVALLARPAPSDAKASFGDYVKAARALQEWRFDDAKVLVAALQKEAPDAPETRYIVAEQAFLLGEYERAAKLLDKLDHPDVREVVGDLRPLVESTLEATGGFAKRTTPGGHFIIYYSPGKDELLVDLAGETLEAAYTAIGEDLGYTPPDPMRVEILPRIDDLARVSTLAEKDIETSGTIALCKYNKLMIVSPRATLFGYPWLDTLAHEYTHYVITRATGDRVAIWLQEGLAKFEETRWRQGAGEQKLGRLYEHLLAAALKKNKLITFDQMHPSMAKLPSQEAASTAFAEVYTMVDWIEERIGYAGIRTVLAKVADGKSDRRAVAEALGEKTWDDVERMWKKHLKGLGLKTEPGAAEKGKKRLRFQKSEKDEENVGIDGIPEERVRKLARLGGLLRARGKLAAAAVEYEKARAIDPDEPFIAHKLARTYLELGDAKKAIEIASPLVAKDEEDVGPLATLGAAYLAAGEKDKAREHLLAALRISPFDPAVRCGLAEIYEGGSEEEKGRRERAACEKLNDTQ